VLQELRLEEEARLRDDAVLKRTRRAEFDIGWKATEHVPRNEKPLKKLAGVSASHGMVCLSLDETTRTVRASPTLELELP